MNPGQPSDVDPGAIEPPPASEIEPPTDRTLPPILTIGCEPAAMVTRDDPILNPSIVLTDTVFDLPNGSCRACTSRSPDVDLTRVNSPAAWKS